MKKEGWILIEALISLLLVSTFGLSYLEYFLNQYQYQKKIENKIIRESAMQEKIRDPKRKVLLPTGEEVHYEKKQSCCKVWVVQNKERYSYKARIYTD